MYSFRNDLPMVKCTEQFVYKHFVAPLHMPKVCVNRSTCSFPYDCMSRVAFMPSFLRSLLNSFIWLAVFQWKMMLRCFNALNVNKKPWNLHRLYVNRIACGTCMWLKRRNGVQVITRQHCWQTVWLLFYSPNLSLA